MKRHKRNRQSSFELLNKDVVRLILSFVGLIEVTNLRSLSLLSISLPLAKVLFIKQNIGVVESVQLVEELANNIAVEEISIRFSEVSMSAVASLLYNNDPYKQFLRPSPKIAIKLLKLNLSDTLLNAADAITLANTLRFNKGLVELVLARNNVGDRGAGALANAVGVNPTLTVFDIEANGIGAFGASMIIHRSLKRLESLNISRNDTGVHQTIMLSMRLMRNVVPLRKLNIGYSCIGRGAQALCRSLQTNTLLEDLNIEFCDLGTLGGVAIAEGLKLNKSLKQLNIKGNKIKVQGGIALANALKINSALTLLDISENYIKHVGAIALASALKVNKSLQVLDISCNEIDLTGVMALTESLKVNRTLLQFHIAQNRIGQTGAAAIGDALKRNQVLTHLNIQSNDIREEGVKSLIDALKTNTTLQALNLARNAIGHAGKDALSKVCAYNLNCIITY